MVGKVVLVGGGAAVVLRTPVFGLDDVYRTVGVNDPVHVAGVPPVLFVIFGFLFMAS
jgi:hypothetical protein